MRKLLLVGCAALVLGGSAAVATSQTPRNETFRMLELFGDVVGIVEQAYVVPVDNKKLIEAALAGMMTALDPHSNYLSPEGYGDLQERTSGEYSGVGLTITSEGGLVKVISPMDESPAARAGVQAGDVISAIEGQNAAGLTVSQVSEKLRGAAGTSVRVTFLRDGEEPREVTLTREIIKVQSVTGRVEGDFGYLRVSTFNENTGRELTEAIAKIKAEKPGVKGYVLDLRNNEIGDAGIAALAAALASPACPLEQLLVSGNPGLQSARAGATAWGDAVSSGNVRAATDVRAYVDTFEADALAAAENIVRDQVNTQADGGTSAKPSE
jgi:carboxyl-terminal processing protease